MSNQRLSLTVTLETVTPMFLGGAEARGAPELRPPAFRGVMRYWLRAALGGVIGDQNLKDLHRLESAVFGSTEAGSPIMVRLVNQGLSYQSENILPHKPGGKRLAFKAGQSFKLIMRQLRSEAEVWAAACAALNLALTFGGVGLRSRRGYGVLRVSATSDASLLPTTPTSLPTWSKQVEQATSSAISAASALAKVQNVPLRELPSGPTAYPCANRTGMIWLHDLKAKSAMDAVESFMRKASGDAAFGGINPKRQASPLWMRPVQLDGSYGLLFAVLASQFAGNDYKKVQTYLQSDFAGTNISVKGWNA